MSLAQVHWLAVRQHPGRASILYARWYVNDSLPSLTVVRTPTLPVIQIFWSNISPAAAHVEVTSTFQTEILRNFNTAGTGYTQ